jgi:hypothetical protein
MSGEDVGDLLTDTKRGMEGRRRLLKDEADAGAAEGL